MPYFVVQRAPLCNTKKLSHFVIKLALLSNLSKLSHFITTFTPVCNKIYINLIKVNLYWQTFSNILTNEECNDWEHLQQARKSWNKAEKTLGNGLKSPLLLWTTNNVDSHSKRAPLIVGRKWNLI